MEGGKPFGPNLSGGNSCPNETPQCEARGGSWIARGTRPPGTEFFLICKFVKVFTKIHIFSDLQKIKKQKRQKWHLQPHLL